MLIGIDFGAIAVTVGVLLAFGTFYNWLVLQLHRCGYNDGYVWLEVVVGVSVTVFVAGFTLGWQTVLLLVIYFAASGLPMAAGDIWRYIRANAAERREQREE